VQKEAIKFYQEALQTYREFLDSDHPRIKEVMKSLQELKHVESER